MKEKDMQAVVDFIDRILMDIDNESTIQAVKEEVKLFMQQFPLYPEMQ